MASNKEDTSSGSYSPHTKSKRTESPPVRRTAASGVVNTRELRGKNDEVASVASSRASREEERKKVQQAVFIAAQRKSKAREDFDKHEAIERSLEQDLIELESQRSRPISVASGDKPVSVISSKVGRKGSLGPPLESTSFEDQLPLGASAESLVAPVANASVGDQQRQGIPLGGSSPPGEVPTTVSGEPEIVKSYGSQVPQTVAGLVEKFEGGASNTYTPSQSHAATGQHGVFSSVQSVPSNVFNVQNTTHNVVNNVDARQSVELGFQIAHHEQHVNIVNQRNQVLEQTVVHMSNAADQQIAAERAEHAREKQELLRQAGEQLGQAEQRIYTEAGAAVQASRNQLYDEARAQVGSMESAILRERAEAQHERDSLLQQLKQANVDKQRLLAQLESKDKVSSAGRESHLRGFPQASVAPSPEHVVAPASNRSCADTFRTVLEDTMPESVQVPTTVTRTVTVVPASSSNTQAQQGTSHGAYPSGNPIAYRPTAPQGGGGDPPDGGGDRRGDDHVDRDDYKSHRKSKKKEEEGEKGTIS